MTIHATRQVWVGANLAIGRRVDTANAALARLTATGKPVVMAAKQALRLIERGDTFISGGAFTPRAHAFLERVTNARIDKPFGPQTVRARVERHLADLRRA